MVFKLGYICILCTENNFSGLTSLWLDILTKCTAGSIVHKHIHIYWTRYCVGVIEIGNMAEVRVHAAFTVKDEGEFLKEAQKMIDATQVGGYINIFPSLNCYIFSDRERLHPLPAVQRKRQAGWVRYDRDMDNPRGPCEPQQVRACQEFPGITERKCFCCHSNICSSLNKIS